MFFKKCVLQICSKYTGKHPCGGAVSVKLQTNFTEMTFPHGCSPVNLLHNCRAAVLTNTYGKLLLQISIQVIESFSNIFLTSSMFTSERAVIRLPKFSLFLFRLVPCERYFVTFCWIIFLQGGT